jgi:hypothetical protein
MMPETDLATTNSTDTAFERTWQLNREAYARAGIDVASMPMDKRIRKLTREEWLKFEEDASGEFEAMMALPKKSLSPASTGISLARIRASLRSRSQ